MFKLSVPHGIANEDIVSQNPGELSCKVKQSSFFTEEHKKKKQLASVTALHIIKCFRLQRLKCGKSNNVLLNNNCIREWYCTLQRGDVLVMLKPAGNNYLECQKGEDTGRVHLSQMKIITPLDEHLRSRANVRN